MRIDPIDSRRNVCPRDLSRTKIWRHISGRPDELRGCLRLAGSFPEDFRDIRGPRAGSTGDWEVRKSDRLRKSSPVADLFPSRISDGRFHFITRVSHTIADARWTTRINFYDSNHEWCQTPATWYHTRPRGYIAIKRRTHPRNSRTPYLPTRHIVLIMSTSIILKFCRLH